MIRVDAAIIGGTGIGERLMAMPGRPFLVPTEFGTARGRLVEHEGVRLAVLQRHSGGHRTPPHRVNYRAMARGVQRLGATVCLSSAAVGSLRADWGPGTIAVCTDFLELTGRRLTLFDRTVVHTDFSDPMPAHRRLRAAAEAEGVVVQPSAVYVGGDGPRYETPAEIRMLAGPGGDVVGMTASTEAVLMREAGVAYGCLAVVTNLGCGLAAGELTHDEVTDVMKEHGPTVVRLLLRAAVATRP